MDQVYYQKGTSLVTSKLFKTARKTYRTTDIEKITLRRPFFFASLPLAVCSYYLRDGYSAYLYDYEQWICIVMFTAVPLVAWFIGTMSVTSKSLTDDTAIVGLMPRLVKLREAVERAIYLPDEAVQSKNDRQFADAVDG